jgi:hypothetical protein
MEQLTRMLEDGKAILLIDGLDPKQAFPLSREGRS